MKEVSWKLWVLGVGVAMLMQGCAYRFSNLHTPQYSLKTIAVESVYDTSSEVLPHEVMWLEMQKALIRDGRLQLTNPTHADALVTMHIKSALLEPSGSIIDLDRTVKNKSSRIDPKLFNGSEPPIYSDLKTLTRAGELSDKQTLSSVVNVKIMDLHRKRTLLNRTYSLKEVFISVDNIGDAMNEFLNHEEKLTSDFKRISQELANRVIQDFFITH